MEIKIKHCNNIEEGNIEIIDLNAIIKSEKKKCKKKA